jgi:hypothetical protein
MDDEQSGEAVARALRSAQAAPVRQALVGCQFYCDDPDLSHEIIAAPAEDPVIVIRQADGDRRLAYAALAQGYVIDPQGGLGPAVTASRSPRDEALDHAERVIGRYGVKPTTIGREHWIALADIFQADAGVLPQYDTRQERYRLLKRYDLARQGAEILERWRSLLPAEDTDGATQIAIGLAWCHRHAGQAQAALAVTDILVAQGGRLKPSAVAVLACERAAILLDLYERDGNSQRLTEARQWVDRSYAFNQNDHARQVYNRLRSLTAPG